MTTDRTVVADEPHTDLARLVGLVDTANGIAVRQPRRDWMFPNVDLTSTCTAPRSAAWVGLDVNAVFGPSGVGLTSASSSTPRDRSVAPSRS